MSSSRAVHPAYMPMFPATGVELSCWAYIYTPRPQLQTQTQKTRNKKRTQSRSEQNEKKPFPNLVTAQGSTIRIYEYIPKNDSGSSSGVNLDEKTKNYEQHEHDEKQGSLFLIKMYQVSGIICTLDTLPNARSYTSKKGDLHVLFDGLLIGFAGNPRLAIVYPNLVSTPSSSNHYHHYNQNKHAMDILQPSSIIDLSPALMDRCKGATSPLDVDVSVAVCCEYPRYDSDNENDCNGEDEKRKDNGNKDDEYDFNDMKQNESNPNIGIHKLGGKPIIAAIILGGGVCLAAFAFVKGVIPKNEMINNKNANDIDKDEIIRNITNENNDPEQKYEKNDNDSNKNPDKEIQNYEIDDQDWWYYASEPYLIDLHALSRSIASFRQSSSPYSSNHSTNMSLLSSKYGNPRDKSQKDQISGTGINGESNENTSFCSTWGDILSISFLSKYSSPTLAVLHTSALSMSSSSSSSGNASGGSGGNANITSNNGIWAGRISKSSAYKHSCTVTALSISVEQMRSVVIWSSLEGACPCDARFIKAIPNRGGCCVISPNGILCIPHGGESGDGGKGKATTKIKAPTTSTPVLACNGFAHTTIAAVKYPNPRPLPLLDIHIDGCRMEFINENVALLVNRDGRVYSFEIHTSSDSTSKTPDKNSYETNNEPVVLSCSPLPYRMEQGASSTLSIFPLWKSLSPTSTNNTDLPYENPKKYPSIDFQGIGVVFCGSQFGDSVLFAYHYVHTKLDDLSSSTSSTEHSKNIEHEEDDAPKGTKRKLSEIKEKEGENNESHKGNNILSSDVNMKREDVAQDAVEPPTTVSSSSIPEQVHSIENKDIPVADIDKSKNDLDQDMDQDMDQDIDEEALLQQEDMELYEGYTTTESPHQYSNSDDDSFASYDINDLLSKARSSTPNFSSSSGDDGSKINPDYHRPTIHTLTIFPTITTLHTLSAPGPLGPSYRGPSYLGGEETLLMPCGYGPSGGVLMMHSVTDGRNIRNEIDIRGVKCGWFFRKLNLVLLALNGDLDGRKGLIMKWNSGSEDNHDANMSSEKTEMLQEMDLTKWSNEANEGTERLYPSSQSIIENTHVLTAHEWALQSNVYLILVVKQTDINLQGDEKFVIFIMNKGENENTNELKITHSYELSMANKKESTIISITKIEEFGEMLFLGCIWNDGQATLITIAKLENNEDTQDVSSNWEIKESMVPGSIEDGDEVTAMDIFTVFNQDAFIRSFENDEDKENISETMINADTQNPNVTMSQSTNKSADMTRKNSSILDSTDEEFFDAEDLELYGLKSKSFTPLKQESVDVTETIKGSLCIAICRSGNLLQIYNSSLSTIIWEAHGCGQGLQQLSPMIKSSQKTESKVFVKEIRFFYCGPCASSSSKNNYRSLCCAVLTACNDLHVYKVIRYDRTYLFRTCIGNIITRTSNEEKQYRSKLARKGMLPNDLKEPSGKFKYNQLHKFRNISQNSGLFVAISRPLWILYNENQVVGLYHKMRHAAPSGCNDTLVSVFLETSDNIVDDKMNLENEICQNGYMTVHERIGQIGSQRLTYYDGIYDLPTQTNNTLHPNGSGMLLTKIPFGVTVRHIAYLDFSNLSTNTEPLYLLLVSRTLEIDQSFLSDDGLTPEERQQKKEEREKEKTRRQVEADLGGFDVEQEWVEEIEREDIFEVNSDLGGAPKIQVEKHEIWLVCGGQNWTVLDKYQLNDFEHGMSLKVMNLTEVLDDSPSGSTGEVNNGPQSTLFGVVGTGIVDKDGEDIGSRGRVLLFEIKRKEFDMNREEKNLLISLTYEKDVLHGPVASLGCLKCEGINRVVIGAGAEVTVEQWGEDKLTQVGFFHANMQVQDITLFKTFFLLSDAYDSLHFLVWRESDKSLTLLAKDYEPTPVYAAGTISRGGNMSFVCHDDRQNFQFFQYAPKDEAARGGNKLVCRADFHVGIQTISLHNHWCQSSIFVSSSTPQSTYTALKQQDPFVAHGDDFQRFAVHFGTSDGSLSSIIPVNERIYWRLTALQSVMSNALESNCALSHRTWRLYRRSSRRAGCQSNDRKKGVLDGVLLFQFIYLSMIEQEELASAIGSTVELIMDNLLELECANRL